MFAVHIVLLFFYPSLSLLSFVSDPLFDDSDAVSPDMDDKQDEGKMEKHKKQKGTGNKTARPKHEERGPFLFCLPSADDDVIN